MLEHLKNHKLKYAIVAAAGAILILMIYFGVGHDGFTGLND